MSKVREKCQNCSETYYKQSLFPLECVDFAFGGQNVTLIGCFVESTVHQPAVKGCPTPKVCRTCLDLLRTTFSGLSHTLANGDSMKRAHKCATCTDYFPTSVMMSMQLTVINFDGKGVKLIDCYKTCTNQEALNGDGSMVCLACVSALANMFVRQKEIKVEIEVFEPIESKTLEVKVEPELQIESIWSGEDCMAESHIDTDSETNGPPNLKRPRKTKRPPKKLARLAPNDEPELFKSLIDPYECSFCKERFRDRVTLTEHLKQHRSETWPGWPGYNKTDSYPCPICQRVMTTNHRLKHHLISSHYANNTFQCHHCPVFRTLTKANMEEHLLLRHFDIEQKCPDCPLVLPNRRKYLTHIKKHNLPDQLQCQGCKRCFAFPQHYRFHIETYKTVINCKSCDAAFHTVRTLDTHMQVAHKFVFTCDVCQLPLANRLALNSHLRIHHNIHVKPSCKYCAQEFDTMDELTTHQMSAHVSRNFTCETCGKNFITRPTMLNHVSTQHPEETAVVVKEHCPICNKGLKNQKILQRHIKQQHTEGKEKKKSSVVYACPECPQWKFGRHQQLEAHMIVHNTEDRQFFPCLSCGVAFTRKQKFDVHVQKCSKIP